MPACPDTNNPSGLKCPTNMRRYAIVGEGNEWIIEHDRSETVTLFIGDKSYVILSRQREARYEVTHEVKFDAQSCQGGGDGYTQYQYNYATAYAKDVAKIEDNLETLDAFVQYMDLRHDFVLLRQVTDSISKSTPSDGQVLWNTYGVTKYLDKFLPEDTDVSAVHSNLPALLATKPEDVIIEVFKTYALPLRNGTPQNNEPEDYFLLNYTTAEENGGYDLYYPEWLRGAGYRNDYDLADKNMRWSYVSGASTQSHGDINISLDVADTAFVCSAAHDRLGRYMVSMTDVTGAHRAIITDTLPEGDDNASLTEAQTEELLGGTKLAYPIGIS